MNDFLIHNKKKIIYSSIAGTLLVLLYLLIFSFSEQNGEESGNLSYYICERCIEILNSLSGRRWSDLMMQGMAEYFENPVRKFAHFAEYACMGILVYSFLAPWMLRGKRLYFVVIIWVFLSAAADEIHQLFVPGRCGSFWDVLLDTCGGVFGMFVCVMIGKWLSKRHFRIKQINNVKI